MQINDDCDQVIISKQNIYNFLNVITKENIHAHLSISFPILKIVIIYFLYLCIWSKKVFCLNFHLLYHVDIMR